MLKTIFSRALSKRKTAVLVAMALGILVLTAVAAVAQDYTTKTKPSLKLNKTSFVGTALTGLASNAVGPALTLRTDNETDPNATPLSLETSNGSQAPMTVNTEQKVADLNVDKVDGQSLECPNGTLFHEGACIETTKRNQTNFSEAGTTCRNASRRLPTIAELQSLRFREGDDFTTDNGEWTSHIGVDGTLLLAGSVNGSTGFTDMGAQDVSRHFRCVALPS